MTFQDKNRAQLTFNRVDTDFTCGVGQIPYQSITSDWRPYVRDNEPQRLKFDTNGCSEFTPMVSSVEAQLNYLLQEDLIEVDDLNFFQSNGYIVDGQFQCSVEFNAILAGTTVNGNTPLNFAISVKHDGIIPQSMLEMSVADSQKYNTQEEQDAAFYSQDRISLEMKELGRESLQHFNSAYQWIQNGMIGASMLNLKTSLQQAPLVLGIPVPRDLTNYNGGFVQYDGGTNLDHCVGLVYTDLSPFPFYVHDNYNPYIKQLSSNYYIPQVLQIIITPIISPPETPTSPVAGFNITKPLSYGSIGIQVFLLQNRLIQDGVATFLMPTGFFGRQTQVSVGRYQTKYMLSLSGYLDPETLAHIQRYG